MNLHDLSKQYEVKKIASQDIPAVYKLCSGNPDYYRFMNLQPTPENLTEVITVLPPGKKLEDKYFVGFWEGGSLLAILDLILDYPVEKTVFVGWFMLEKARQGDGVGSALMREILEALHCAGMKKVRLGCIKSNRRAYEFWKKHGFTPIGEETEQKDDTIIAMEREW